jgi:hypothetical protein
MLRNQTGGPGRFARNRRLGEQALRPARRIPPRLLGSHTRYDEHLSGTANQTNSALQLDRFRAMGCLVGALLDHVGRAAAGL